MNINTSAIKRTAAVLDMIAVVFLYYVAYEIVINGYLLDPGKRSSANTSSAMELLLNWDFLLLFGLPLCGLIAISLMSVYQIAIISRISGLLMAFLVMGQVILFLLIERYLYLGSL